MFIAGSALSTLDFQGLVMGPNLGAPHQGVMEMTLIPNKINTFLITKAIL